MTIQAISDAILGQAGLLFMLLFILWAGWKRYWVFGSYYTEMQTELRDRLVDERKLRKDVELRLDRALGAAETGTGIANRALQQAEGRAHERTD